MKPALSMLPALVAVNAVIFTMFGCRHDREPEMSEVLDTSAEIQPLPERFEENELCGVDHYRSEENKLCGPKQFKLARTVACGVELYKSGTGLSCPGSVAADSYSLKTTGGCRSAAPEPAACKSGYTSIRLVSRTKQCSGGNPRLGTDWSDETKIEQVRTCERPQKLNSCRHPDFKVERYKECRDQSHGVEKWNTCERPEFGVPTYKKCAFYLAPGEIDRYLKSVNELLPYMGETAFSARATYYVDIEDDSAFGCYIDRYSNDPLFAPQVDELKTLYQVRFGRPFDAGSLQCDAATASDIDAESCADDDPSRKCRSVRSYRGAKKWLTVKLLDLEHLQNDAAAKRNQQVSEAIAKQHAALKDYDK